MTDIQSIFCAIGLAVVVIMAVSLLVGALWNIIELIAKKYDERKRNCMTCKYCECEYTDDPCCNCTRSNVNFDQWEERR